MDKSKSEESVGFVEEVSTDLKTRVVKVESSCVVTPFVSLVETWFSDQEGRVGSRVSSGTFSSGG